MRAAVPRSERPRSAESLGLPNFPQLSTASSGASLVIESAPPEMRTRTCPFSASDAWRVAFIMRLWTTRIASRAPQSSSGTRCASGPRARCSTGARGELVGAVPFGFVLAADGVHLEPHAEEQAVIAAARELHAQELSLRAVASAFGERGFKSRTGRPFAHEQVARMLRAAA